MDTGRLSRELLRHWRGRRSQAALSRRLGYRSNVVFDWESGRRKPSAASALALARRTGVDIDAAIPTFMRAQVAWAKQKPLDTPDGVRQLLVAMRGGTKIVDLATRLGMSRYSVGRWLGGETEPSFAQLLAYIEVCTLRLLDFVATLAAPEQLPSIRKDWLRLQTTRDLAYDVPWSHAVLRVLELVDYRQLCRHEPGFIARRLGISLQEEERCLQLLAETGQIQRKRGLWTIRETGNVDTRYDPARSRGLRAFWSEAAATRLRQGADGEFGFNLFGVSRKDYARLRQLQRDYFAQLRSIVGSSEPVETVVLANVHLFALDHAPQGDDD